MNRHDRRVLLLASEPSSGFRLDHHGLVIVELQCSLQGAMDVVGALQRADDPDGAVCFRERDCALRLDIQLLLQSNAKLTLHDEIRLPLRGRHIPLRYVDRAEDLGGAPDVRDRGGKLVLDADMTGRRSRGLRHGRSWTGSYGRTTPPARRCRRCSVRAPSPCRHPRGAGRSGRRSCLGRGGGCGTCAVILPQIVAHRVRRAHRSTSPTTRPWGIPHHRAWHEGCDTLAAGSSTRVLGGKSRQRRSQVNAGNAPAAAAAVHSRCGPSPPASRA